MARTKLTAALVQLIGSGLTLMTLVVEYLVNRLAPDAVFRAFNRSPIEEVSQLALLVSIVSFPAGYLWYAIRHKEA
jgi:hypothetical protein